MNYTELSLKIASDFEVNKDLLVSYLTEIGFDGFVEEDPCLKAYLPSEKFDQNQVDEILGNNLFNGIILNQTVQIIQPKNWNEVWEKNYFEPIAIGNEIFVRGSFHKSNSNFKHEIIIDPKMSFGTGHHQTTKMMLESMMEISLEGKSVMDMGCGTGILAIYAAQKGANPVIAIDIDEWSVTNTLENIETNHQNTKIQVYKGEGSLLPKLNLQFDVFLANINLGVLLYDMDLYKKFIKPGGLLLLSGFLISDKDSIQAELGAESINIRTQGEWCQMVFSV